ncbi:MAG: HNH endonuclease [Opitutaceae bacterium]|nr:HNH endonuclease [Opitutaceae bacterium]
MNYHPIKPFPEYKWRWATLTPTESLNRPSIFLGVLRAFQKHSGEPPSSINLQKTLGVVEKDTNSDVALARSTDRNLIRNSGQYWKSLGVIEKDTRGRIDLTPFGKMVGNGEITQIEFALTIVKSMVLPNPNIETEQTISKWESHGLKISPLLLILKIISELYLLQNDNGYITANELIKIVIPLNASNYNNQEIVQAIVAHREGTINIDSWEDFCPAANDRRMAREFMLFLEYNHLIKKSISNNRSAYDEKYILDCISIEEIVGLNITDETYSNNQILDELIIDDIPYAIERRRASRDILERPNQANFRKNILNAYTEKCLITGVNIRNVLEAAHIVPVSEDGIDHVSNGICLRTDIHRLFDTGHLKIRSDGELSLSKKAMRSENYGDLPEQIYIPDFINKEFLKCKRSF